MKGPEKQFQDSLESLNHRESKDSNLGFNPPATEGGPRKRAVMDLKRDAS